ncbi:MAG: 3'(2'),5'-bisphosphate nucleotidase [Calditrichaeota bacterium]|nr:MAG: 3'(2'),5'-bisphosphate nucleotidase [Calditrichota bacterium]
MAFEKELRTAIQAVGQAVRLCTGVQFKLIDQDTLQKKDRSPVTIADYGSQAIISEFLEREFPQDLVVGEEDVEALKSNPQMLAKVLSMVQEQLPYSTEQSLLAAIERGNAPIDLQKRFWTVDPVDGTKGFLRKEQYAVALALIDQGEIRLGVLGCPNLPMDFNDPLSPSGYIFYAVRSEGAFACEITSGHPYPIYVDRLADFSRVRFAESVESSHSAHADHARISASLGISTEPLRIDSQCKYAAVARGDVSIYLRFPTDSIYREKIWDHAAGHLIVEEAGGKVTDITGKPLDFSQGRQLTANRGVVVSNGTIHDAIIDAIKAL